MYWAQPAGLLLDHTSTTQHLAAVYSYGGHWLAVAITNPHLEYQIHLQ